MIYKIEYTKSAQKELKKLPKDVTIRVIKALVVLSNDPKVGNVRPMVGLSSWRLRVGDYRVIYDINGGKLLILIIKIAHRKHVYR